MGSNKKVFVYGAGGHAKVVIDALEMQGYTVAAVLDDNEALKGTSILGYPVFHTLETLDTLQKQDIRYGIVGIGNNRIRQMQAGLLISKGFELVTAIHPSAVISKYARIGIGTVVMAGVTVNPEAKIGDNVILNTNSTVDHDCIIENACHIGPGASLGGTVHIGERTLVGTGASVIHNCRIGADVVVGAGAAVISDLPGEITAVGVPARVLKE